MFKRSQVPAAVRPEEAAELQLDGAVLLDVREDDEWQLGHAPGATHVPLSDVGAAASRFDGQRVLTVCRSGGRSAQAAATLAAAGIEVHNVEGGMSSWLDAGLPVVLEDTSPGTVA